MSEIPPRRRLPWDVLLLVFKQADPPTLAVLGRVSYDFLTSASAELYRDVKVTSVEQSEALFCERKVVQAGRKTKNSSKSSRINTPLSLSQTRTLSIDLTSLASVPDFLTISSSRIDNATPIPLRHLQMSFDHKTRESAELLYSFLLPLLNPSRCSCKAVGDRTEPTDWQPLDLGRSIGGTHLAGWKRLEVLDLACILPYVTPPGPEPRSLGGLPRPTSGRRRVVRLRLTDTNPDAYCLFDYEELLGLDFMQPASFSIVVRTEDQREHLANVIRTQRQFARWKDVFVVEVAT